MKATNIFRTENEFTQGYNKIWPFGRLHTSRFRRDIGFRYGLALSIGTLKIMASSVLSCVVYALKHSTSSFSTTPWPLVFSPGVSIDRRATSVSF